MQIVAVSKFWDGKYVCACRLCIVVLTLFQDQNIAIFINYPEERRIIYFSIINGSLLAAK